MGTLEVVIFHGSLHAKEMMRSISMLAWPISRRFERADPCLASVYLVGHIRSIPKMKKKKPSEKAGELKPSAKERIQKTTKVDMVFLPRRSVTCLTRQPSSTRSMRRKLPKPCQCSWHRKRCILIPFGKCGGLLIKVVKDLLNQQRPLDLFSFFRRIGCRVFPRTPTQV